jgi:hypothetical protein
MLKLTTLETIGDALEWEPGVAPSLDALLRRAGRLAGELFEYLSDDGLDLTFLIESANGHAMIALPIYSGSWTEARARKERMSENLRRLFLAHGVTRYASFAEMWVRDRHPIEVGGEIIPGKIIGETVHLLAEDNRERIKSERDIIRPAHGKPYLGTLKEITRVARSHEPVGLFNDLIELATVQ